MTLNVEFPHSDIKVQNNVIRGNAGSVIEMQPLYFAFVPVEERPRMLIQNNYFSAGARSALWFIQIYFFQTLLFQGNNCEEETRGAFTYLPIYMSADRINVSGNTVTFAEPTSLYVVGSSVLVNANTVDAGPRALQVYGSTRTIVSSNITQRAAGNGHWHRDSRTQHSGTLRNRGTTHERSLQAAAARRARMEAVRLHALESGCGRARQRRRRHCGPRPSVLRIARMAGECSGHDAADPAGSSGHFQGARAEAGASVGRRP